MTIRQTYCTSQLFTLVFPASSPDDLSQILGGGVGGWVSVLEKEGGIQWLACLPQDFSGPRQPFISKHLIASVVEQC